MKAVASTGGNHWLETKKKKNLINITQLTLLQEFDIFSTFLTACDFSLLHQTNILAYLYRGLWGKLCSFPEENHNEGLAVVSAYGTEWKRREWEWKKVEREVPFAPGNEVSQNLQGELVWFNLFMHQWGLWEKSCCPTMKQQFPRWRLQHIFTDSADTLKAFSCSQMKGNLKYFFQTDSIGTFQGERLPIFALTVTLTTAVLNENVCPKHHFWQFHLWFNKVYVITLVVESKSQRTLIIFPHICTYFMMQHYDVKIRTGAPGFPGTDIGG